MRRSRGPGPPNDIGLPRGWPSPTTMSAPNSEGGSTTPSRTGFAPTTSSAPAVVGDLGRSTEILEPPKEVRVTSSMSAATSPCEMIERAAIEIGEPLLLGRYDHDLEQDRRPRTYAGSASHSG